MSRRSSVACSCRGSCRSGTTAAGWIRSAPAPSAMPGAPPAIGTPTILADVDAATWARLSLAPWVIAPADPQRAHALVLAGLADGARVTAAVVGSAVVGARRSSRVDGARRGDAPRNCWRSAWRPTIAGRAWPGATPGRARRRRTVPARPR